MFETKEDKIKKKTHNLFTEILAVYEIMWKNIVEPRRPHMAI
jgi:hypothetical protein